MLPIINLSLFVIRGDLPVNEIKLKNALHCQDLHLATDAEVTEHGIGRWFRFPRRA